MPPFGVPATTRTVKHDVAHGVGLEPLPIDRRLHQRRDRCERERWWQPDMSYS